MRKLFSLFAAMLVALTVSAKVWTVGPNHNEESDRADCNLYVTLDRLQQAGDTILLADGVYDEPYSASIKSNVVIMAAEDAHPVLNSKGYYELKASAKIVGVKFTFSGDAGSSYAVYVRENTAKYLIIEDCEFTGFSKACITGSSSSSHIDSIIVNNCYFHDNATSAIYCPASSLAEDVNFCDKLKVTNSTFANATTLNGAGVLDNRNNGSNSSSTSTMIVDHCTFYNCEGYERIMHAYKSPLFYVSNCIVANPTTPASGTYATYAYGGEVKNCLTFNNSGHRNWSPAPTITDCSTGDPLFVNAASGNYTLGEGSPALDAGTDGSNLGDPRWWPVPAPAGCNWESLPWIATAALPQFDNQFKICLGDPAPGVDVIQNPGFATAPGLYITFPSADFGAISLASTDYDIQGAGMILHMDAFTAKETEVTIVCQGVDYIFTIYNDKGSDIPTAIDNADAKLKATKRIENGQLFIEVNGVRYNVIGAKVR